MGKTYRKTKSETKSKKKLAPKFVPKPRKICAFCAYPKTIFKNTPEGPQCWDCYRQIEGKKRSNAYSKANKSKNSKNVITQSPILEADAKLSVLVRKIHMSNGIIKCYTCGIPMTMKEAENGHFIPRSQMATRWLLDNCRPQCYNCNRFLNGNLKEFEKRLERDIPGITDKLRILGKQVFKPSDTDIKEIIDDLTTQIVALMKNGER